jgi:hypothetical protein
MAASRLGLPPVTRRHPWRYVCLTVTLLGGCAVAGQVIPPVSYDPAATKTATAGIRNYPTAAAIITSVLVEELKLPPIDTVIIIYSSVAEYEAGFLEEASLTRSQTAEKAYFLARASCRQNKIMVNGPELARLPWSGRMRALAHELTHMAVYSLGKQSCNAAHAWLSEGFAVWSSEKVLDALKIRSLAGKKAEYRAELQTDGAKRAVPSLGQMSLYSDWENLVRSVGGDAANAKAFLAVDFLIERKALPAVLEYFRLFARSNDPDGNFLTAFGQDVSSFEREFVAEIAATGR